MVKKKTKGGREFWIGNEASPDGKAVFSLEEFELLRRSHMIMDQTFIDRIFDAKEVFGGTLEDISQRLSEEDNPPSNAWMDLGNVRKNHKPNAITTGLAICSNVINMLKGKGAKTKEEKKKEFERSNLRLPGFD